MRIVIPALLAAIVAVALALVWLLFPERPQGPGDGLGEIGGTSGPAIDSGARIDIEMIRGQIEALQSRVAELEAQLARVSARATAPVLPEAPEQALPDGPNTIIDSYAQVVLVADRRNLNQGLTVASPSFLVEKLGMPADSLGDSCQAMRNPRLAERLVLEEVGPVRVRMLQPAIDSLRRVFDKIYDADPDLFARIDTAGSLCVRRIRGTTNRVSSHAFGLSVDLNIDGYLDTLGDGRTQLGLTILADFFNEEGWIWGAAFGREDSMHFEVSREKIEEWLRDGSL